MYYVILIHVVVMIIGDVRLSVNRVHIVAGVSFRVKMKLMLRNGQQLANVLKELIL